MSEEERECAKKAEELECAKKVLQAQIDEAKLKLQSRGGPADIQAFLRNALEDAGQCLNDPDVDPQTMLDVAADILAGMEALGEIDAAQEEITTTAPSSSSQASSSSAQEACAEPSDLPKERSSSWHWKSWSGRADGPTGYKFGDFSKIVAGTVYSTIKDKLPVRSARTDEDGGQASAGCHLNDLDVVGESVGQSMVRVQADAELVDWQESPQGQKLDAEDEARKAKEEADQARLCKSVAEIAEAYKHMKEEAIESGFLLDKAEEHVAEAKDNSCKAAKVMGKASEAGARYWPQKAAAVAGGAGLAVGLVAAGPVGALVFGSMAVVGGLAVGKKAKNNAKEVREEVLANVDASNK